MFKNMFLNLKNFVLLLNVAIFIQNTKLKRELVSFHKILLNKYTVCEGV